MPIKEEIHDTDSSLRAETPFVSARTSRAYLSCRRTKHRSERDAFIEVLATSTRQKIGQLEWCDEEEKNSLFSIHDAEVKIEMVAVCKGYVSIIGSRKHKDLMKQGKEEDLTDESEDEDQTDESEDENGMNKNEYIKYEISTMDCYFVLCIAWKDGIAYRKGSRHVYKEAWEHEKEDELVDLILG